MRLCVLLMLLIAGCGKRETGEFEKYVQVFEAEGAARGSIKKVFDITVELDPDLPADVVGRCYSGGLSTPRVVINPNIWATFDEEAREIAILHELGHCILGKPHDSSRPAIMNPRAPQSWGGNRTAMLDYFYESSTAVNLK